MLEVEMFKHGDVLFTAENVNKIETKEGVLRYIKERVFQFSAYKKRMSYLIRQHCVQ